MVVISNWGSPSTSEKRLGDEIDCVAEVWVVNVRAGFGRAELLAGVCRADVLAGIRGGKNLLEFGVSTSRCARGLSSPPAEVVPYSAQLLVEQLHVCFGGWSKCRFTLWWTVIVLVKLSNARLRQQ